MARARGDPIIKVSFVVPHTAQPELYEFRAGTGAPPFLEGRATQGKKRGGLVGGEYFGHAAVSGK
jgi:hypothetical protein